jgi:hypothetical protein
MAIPPPSRTAIATIKQRIAAHFSRLSDISNLLGYRLTIAVCTGIPTYVSNRFVWQEQERIASAKEPRVRIKTESVQALERDQGSAGIITSYR